MTTPIYNLSVREPIKVIGDIIANEMGLIASGDNCQIMLTNERFPIPVNNNIYVALSYIGPGQVISNTNFSVPTSGGMTETQQVSMLYKIQIDFLSYNPEARMRLAEFPMALASIYAQSAMAINNVGIARQPSAFMDNSDLEVTKYLNRYTTTIAVTALMTKTKPAAYFNNFPLQIEDDDGFESPILTPEDPYNVH